MPTVTTNALRDHAAAAPGKPACVFPDSGAVLSYAALDRRATQAAHWLLSLGLPPGVTVAMLLDNAPEVFQLAFAAERAGLYYTVVSTHLRGPEVEYILRDCAARVLVTRPEYLANVPALPGLAVALVGSSYDEAVDAQPGTPVPDDRPIGRDLLYSSGTTGQPKGILRPLLPPAMRGQPIPLAGVLVQSGILDAETVYLSTGPLYHAAPHRFSLHVVRMGGTCIVPRRFDAGAALALIERYRVTHSQWVPTMFVRMLALPAGVRLGYDLSSHVRAIHAAAPCPMPVKHAMIDWWGPILFEYYAGSETLGATGIESLDWLAHKGSVGRAFSGQVHILDEDGAELPPNQLGHIWFSGLPPFQYLNAPEKTRAAVNPQGWGTYGDIGHLDPDGYLWLSDRRADLIISGGVNIYPMEVEQVLAQHPAVADVGVVGAPDPEMGERVQAAVVLREGSAATAEELIAFCRERLSGVKTPRAVELVPALPRSDVGKLLRRVLKDRYR